MRRALSAVVALSRNPADGEAQHTVQMSLDGPRLRKLVERWETSADGRWLLTHRPSLDEQTLSPARLLAMPEGTLGQALGRFYFVNGFGPGTWGCPRQSATEYAALRLAQAHDLWHTVTGYGADALGELELHAFMLATLGLRVAWVTIGCALALATWRHGFLVAARRMRTAFARGRGRSLDTVVWERWLGTPLEHVRANLGLLRHVALDGPSARHEVALQRVGNNN